MDIGTNQQLLRSIPNRLCHYRLISVKRKSLVVALVIREYGYENDSLIPLSHQNSGCIPFETS